MKKYGSTNAKASVAKKTVRKMLNMPFWAYWVQISTTFLLSLTEAFVGPFQLDVGLDELHRAVGPGRHRLDGSAGEPVDHRAAGDQPEQERRVQDRQVGQELGLESLRQRHDDREDHRRGADHGRADQHRLGGGLERVARAVVLLEVAPWPCSKCGVEAEVLLDLCLDVRAAARSSTARRPTARCPSPGRRSRPRWSPGPCRGTRTPPGRRRRPPGPA